MLCQQAREKRVYLLLEDGRGRYFQDWTAFCVAPTPWGLGLDARLVEELVKEHADPKRRGPPDAGVGLG